MTAITSSEHLNPCRRHRSYPRAVRRRSYTRYRIKKTGETGTRYDGPPRISLISPSPHDTVPRST